MSALGKDTHCFNRQDYNLPAVRKPTPPPTPLGQWLKWIKNMWSK